MLVGIGHIELYFGTFGASNPVALSLFQRVGPVDCVETVEQTLGVCRYAQTPLAHLLLHYRVATAYADAIHYLIVGKYRAELRTPVDHGVGKIGYAVVHQHFLLFLLRVRCPVGSSEVQFLCSQCTTVFRTHQFEVFYQFDGRLCFV